MDQPTPGGISAERLRRLQWRARRGLLENDLVLERFFSRYAMSLDERQVIALDRLLDCTDSDLLDLFLSRTEPAGALDTPDVRALLVLIRGA